MTRGQGLRPVPADGTREAEFGSAVPDLTGPVTERGPAPDVTRPRKLLASA